MLNKALLLRGAIMIAASCELVHVLTLYVMYTKDLTTC